MFGISHCCRVFFHRFIWSSRLHVGVLQGRPARPPRGSEGSASGQSADAAAGRRSGPVDEEGAGQALRNDVRRLLLFIILNEHKMYSQTGKILHRENEDTSSHTHTHTHKSPPPNSCSSEQVQSPHCDTLYLSVHSLAGACVACKGSVISVCEACACPCTVTRHVCGLTVNKCPHPSHTHTHTNTHTHTHTHTHAHSSRRSSAILSSPASLN